MMYRLRQSDTRRSLYDRASRSPRCCCASSKSTEWSWNRDQSPASTAALRWPSSCRQTQRSGHSPDRRLLASPWSMIHQRSGSAEDPHCSLMHLHGTQYWNLSPDTPPVLDIILHPSDFIFRQKIIHIAIRPTSHCEIYDRFRQYNYWLCCMWF